MEIRFKAGVTFSCFPEAQCGTLVSLAPLVRAQLISSHLCTYSFIMAPNVAPKASLTFFPSLEALQSQ